MERSPHIRKPMNLSNSLHKRLDSYSLAADADARREARTLSTAVALGTAGLAMAAGAIPAEAKILYTPIHKVLVASVNHPRPAFAFDIDHLGVKNFEIRGNWYLSTHTTTGYGGFLVGGVGTSQHRQPEVAYRPGHMPFSASAIPAGKVIGTRQTFHDLYGNELGGCNNGGGTCNGPFFKKRNRYVGFKLVLSGEVHYGWARVTVTAGTSHQKRSIKATLTGYAYETTPNKPIIAGKTHGPDVIVRHATLGQLALGKR